MKTQFLQLICDGRQVFKWGEIVYQIIDLESLSATALYTGKLPPMGPGGFGVLPTGNSSKKDSNPSGYPTLKPVRPAKSTEYLKLLKDSNQTIGITHHPTGLGKLKVVDDGTEYGIPIIDILNKPLAKWRIKKK